MPITSGTTATKFAFVIPVVVVLSATAAFCEPAVDGAITETLATRPAIALTTVAEVIFKKVF